MGESMDLGASASAEVVLRFLESVGRRTEAEFYVRLFRAEPKERFAAIAVDASVARHALEAVTLHLKFLAGLGLSPLVVLGLFEPAHADTHAARIVRRLSVQGVPATVFSSVEDKTLANEVARACRQGTLPVVVSRKALSVDARFDALGALLGRLETRKLIFLHRAGGLKHNGVLLPLVNLTTDFDGLLESSELTSRERAIVRQAHRLVFSVPHKLVVTVTSPLNLLRELFTVKGAGTLLRKGAAIVRHGSYAEVDLPRLRALITSGFGRAPNDMFFERPVLRIYLEENYRGCAILTDSPLGPYLTKFTTDPEARGEGIARDLWEAFRGDYPTVFWRARASNPINEWYTKLSDGLMKFPEWWVFWKGLQPEQVPAAIAFALSQPVDLPPPAPGVAATVP